MTGAQVIVYSLQLKPPAFHPGDMVPKGRVIYVGETTKGLTVGDAPDDSTTTVLLDRGNKNTYLWHANPKQFYSVLRPILVPTEVD